MIDAGVPAPLAKKVAATDMLYSSLGVISVSQLLQRDVLDVAHGYFRVGEALGLENFESQVNSATVNSHWQSMARESY